MPKATITNKSDVVLHGVLPGAEKIIDVDDHSVPKDQQWRRRLKDAKLDGCVELKPIKAVKTDKSS